MNEMNFHRADALRRMDSLTSILIKLPRTAGKQLLMSTMEDYRMELMNDIQERETQQKQTAAHLLKDLQSNEAERHSARERKQKAWGRTMLNGVPYSKWDLTIDWLTMTNDLFFEKYGVNWTPSITLQNDVQSFFLRYGNITEDDLKKLYGAIGETKAPLPGDSCMTKPLTQATVNKFVKEQKDTLRDIADILLSKERPPELTQAQLNILGGQRTPGYKMTT